MYFQLYLLYLLSRGFQTDRNDKKYRRVRHIEGNTEIAALTAIMLKLQFYLTQS